MLARDNRPVADAKVRVRPAVWSDGDRIGEVHAASWTSGYVDFFEPEFLSAAARGRRTGWGRSLTRVLVPPNRVLVAEARDRVVAFSHAGPGLSDGAIAEIYGFYAHPSVWGSGAAVALMTATCAALSPEWSSVSLWTLHDAARARGFYEKVGFRTTGRAKVETFSDWLSTAQADQQVVEYGKRL